MSAGRGRRPWLGLALAAAGLGLAGWGLLRVREAAPGAYREASVAAAEAGTPLPGLAVVRGRVLTEAAVRFGPEGGLRFWIPLVSESWTPGAPVAALVLDPGGAALAGLGFRVRALRREVPGAVRAELLGRGIVLAPSAQVLDAAPLPPRTSRWGWRAVIGGILLLAGAIGLVLGVGRRRLAGSRDASDAPIPGRPDA